MLIKLLVMALLTWLKAELLFSADKRDAKSIYSERPIK